MNTRQKEILLLLLSEPNDYLLVQYLAEQVNCSEKTIRNDFKVIEEYLTNYSSAVLVKKPGLGVYLEIEEYEKVDLFNKLYRINNCTTYESDEERILRIAYNLLMNIKAVTAQDMASQHFVSRTTIKKDLDKIEKWLHHFDLTVVSKQRVGLIIEGNEKNKRKALARLSDLICNSELTNQFIKEQFSYHEVEFVTTELKALQKRYELFFSDDAFEGLLIHTLLMVRRMKLKQPILTSEEEMKTMQETKEYKWTLEFLKRLESVFAVHFTEEEATYLTAHILGGKFRYQDKTGGGDKLTESNPILSKVVKQLVQCMTQSCEMDFSRDQILIEGLTIHLYTTLNRLNYDLSVSNPMLHDIKRMYPYMFNMLIQVLEEINKSLNLCIPEEEAAYLTLHFEASVERLNHQEKSKNVIIVCHLGIGMSQLLRTKIERKFHHVHVMDCIAKADLHEYLKKHRQVDLVISTVFLSDLNIPHIVVSPLLEGTEEKKLGDFIKECDEPSYKKQKDFVMLNYTSPFLIFLQQDVQHPYELIEKLAYALHSKGYVDKEYAENAIIREKMSATTIGAGIAIPHGNPKFIKESVIAIATLKEPIDWGSEKVSLVFMLAVKSDGQEVTKRLFYELSLISEQPYFVQKLTKETNVMKFLSYLHN
ncbi:BglG family transcription antiterminator [Bacillus cytotoxicus]|uniref:Transcriptional antiterminator, BglG n=1 Tax=Bacillus cytotoxicus TaxID=580165 RepID=A0AAX2CEL7_9BACI|nr:MULTISPECIES: BglG family transcription antiterminator [Bacillus cereus group]QTR72251.1 BglG family transcription antiterminator [Bacillus cytotoxicus]QTR77387.1 BglG family transcription antiterminator [Bacillus cytotoxicus]QTR82796.1 BglG family transcription antiterminator [Bacillus cytotoxicus]QTR86534.1 BglG family transcription antiterminator [Bacillus cytotoxicus]SCL88271.1 Transcriptional antiterminator, BglG [Bacillus cytotoxicus]